MIKWLFNILSSRHPLKTEWVEDLPTSRTKRSVYVVGGRQFPFNLAIPCPRSACRQLIQLDLSTQLPTARRWKIREESDGTITLSPSVHVTRLKCRCHYWLRRGRVVWCDTPPLFVPTENRHDP